MNLKIANLPGYFKKIKNILSGKTISVIRSSIGVLTKALWKDTPCVFILSTGRTGTQTLATLLNLSSKVDGYHEPNPQLLLERKSARAEVYSNKKKFKNIFIKSRGYALLRSKINNKIYAETSARLTFFAPVIAEILPNAKFIFIHRDPAEIVRSGMRRGWYKNHPADFARILPVEGEGIYEQWDKMEQFSKICWYWNAYNKFAVDFRESINPGRIITLKASEIFNGEAVLKIFEFISAPAPSSKDINYVLDRKLNAQKSSSFPTPEKWSENMYKQLYQFAGETMKSLGYLNK